MKPAQTYDPKQRLRTGLFFESFSCGASGEEEQEGHIEYAWVRDHLGDMERYFASVPKFLTPGWKFYELIDQETTESCFPVDSASFDHVKEAKKAIIANFKRLLFAAGVLGLVFQGALTQTELLMRLWR